jgi:tRNA C32,U32 (ribose-2'-O)-methylase TrmJ
LTIVCYEIFKLFNEKLFKKNKFNIEISSKSKINSLIKHLLILLEKKEFFVPKEKKKSMVLNINNLIYRLEPNDKELRILASIFSSLSKKNIKP